MFGQKQLHLFNMYGFKVRLDPSWLVIAFLLVWTLAGAFFPAQVKGLSTTAYIVMGVVGVIGLFASIVVHEFIHAMVGRHYGMPMKGITLFIFGGIAEMDEHPRDAKGEFWMALSGPVASAVIAAIFYGIYRMSAGFGWPASLTAVIDYLWQINVVLAVFNMIPAFPLDGGRVLRALLWRWKGRLGWATKISAAAGAGFGMVLIILGILTFLTGNLIGGLWYVLLGLFIRFIAQSSYRRLIVQRQLAGETVDQFMTRDPVTVRPQTTVEQLIEDYFYRYHYAVLPVVSEGRLVGCVSYHHVASVAVEQRAATEVAQIVQPCSPTMTVDQGKPLSEVIERFSRHRQGRIFVVDGEQLVGVINSADVLNHMAIKLELQPHDETDDDGQASSQPTNSRAKEDQVSQAG